MGTDRGDFKTGQEKRCKDRKTQTGQNEEKQGRTGQEKRDHKGKTQHTGVQPAPPLNIWC